MNQSKTFLVDVGMKDLPFPILATSKTRKEGQPTIANVSVSARIMGELETRWIDKFIHILHGHRGQIGTKTLRHNVTDYLKGLNATAVAVDMDYPFFVEKTTPVSKEKCLVRYLCSYSAKSSSSRPGPTVTFKVQVPVITTYPGSRLEVTGGLFGQLSIFAVEIRSSQEIFPEDIIEIVEAHALAPVYSFLTDDDQIAIIQKVHSQEKLSTVTLNEIKDDLARNGKFDWYAVRCINYGMLHSYSTIIGTERSMWVPFSGYEADEI